MSEPDINNFRRSYRQTAVVYRTMVPEELIANYVRLQYPDGEAPVGVVARDVRQLVIDYYRSQGYVRPPVDLIRAVMVWACMCHLSNREIAKQEQEECINESNG
jgi:hypothetical protein